MIINMPTLFTHQKDAINRFLNTGVHAFYHDVGVGKTLSALKCYERMKERGACKLLVICPLSLIESSWADDITKFTNFKYVNWNKSNQYIESDVHLINPESAITSKKLKFINWLADKHNTICVVDESQKLKGYKSKITRTCLNFRNKFQSKIVMSATPAPNDESEYWGQMAFLNDNIFGANFFRFRYYFFNLQRGNFSMPIQGLRSTDTHALIKKGFRFKLREDKREEFYERMDRYVHFVRKEDVFDLPEQVDVIRYVYLPPELKKIYRDMERKLKTELQGQDVVALNALSKLTRLRQIISGFSKSDTGDIVKHKESPKLTELKNVLDEIGDKQVMIFAEYHEEIDDIARMLKDKRFSILDGRTKDKDDAIKSFQNKSSQYLVANPKSGGVGLSFNDVDYCIFYSLSYSSENYYQCRGRIHRANKQNKATYIHLLAHGTLDQLIMGVVKEKKKQMDLVEEFLK